MFLFLVLLSSRRTVKDIGTYGSETHYVGESIKEKHYNGESLVNPITYFEVKMRYSYIENCLFEKTTSTAIMFSKNTDFMANIKFTTFSECSSATTNGGAICVQAIDGGRIWLSYLCGVACASEVGGQFIYVESVNTTMNFVSCVRCPDFENFTDSLYFNTNEYFYADGLNASCNLASKGSIMHLLTSHNNEIHHSTFEYDVSETDCPINIESAIVTYDYINIINASSEGSIVLLDATSEISFKNTFTKYLTIGTQFVVGPAGSKAYFMNCQLSEITNTNAADVATEFTKSGVIPVDTYYIRLYRTAGCHVLFTIPTSSPYPSSTPEIIDNPTTDPTQSSETTVDENNDSDGIEWWVWLVIGLISLLLLLALLYLFFMVCPEVECCECCCCECCRCMIGNGRCRCRRRVCDMRCGHVKCCRNTAQCENYDVSDTSDMIREDKKLESCGFTQSDDSANDEDTEKIINKAYDGAKNGGQVIVGNPKNSKHINNALITLAKDRQKLAKEVGEKDNIINKQMTQMEKMESDDCDEPDSPSESSYDQSLPTQSLESDTEDYNAKPNPFKPQKGKITSNQSVLALNTTTYVTPGIRQPGITNDLGHISGSRSLSQFKLKFGNLESAYRQVRGPAVSKHPELKKLFYAINECKFDEMSSILKRYPQYVNMRNSHGLPPLYVAAQTGSVEACRLLLDLGADINYPNKFGHSPLHRAACLGHLDVCKFLVTNGCKLDTKTNWGFTPLDRAIQKNHPEVAQYLISAGASLTEKDNYGNTPLHRAAKYGRSTILPYILSKGVDINVRGSGGMTPLHFAIEGGSVKTADELVSYGANIKARTNDGRTAEDFCPNEEMRQWYRKYI